jgi:hypothetical protein
MEKILPEEQVKLLNTQPNKACTRRVGVCAIYKHFSSFGFFYISNIIHARPHAGNANRWALAS